MERTAETRRYSRTYSRNYARKKEEIQIKESFTRQITISLIMIIGVLFVEGIHTDVTDKISVKVKEVISADASFADIKSAVEKSKNKVLDLKQNIDTAVESDGKAGRIDEDILNQMNDDTDLYYENQKK